MLREVQEGLAQPQKSLPSKYFYDRYGSQLFDKITRLEEYYPTRTERKLLEDYALEIGEYLGDRVLLIEPGSGSSEKTRILLDKLNTITGYIPIDISGKYLQEVAKELRREYPDLEISPLGADYTRPIQLPELSVEGRRIVFFPGSTIGNFKRETVHRFMKVVTDLTGREGAFLIGVDLKKDVEVLEAAYNDSKGITAAFNKNILTHINDELGTGFDLEKFNHRAIWNEQEGRIEMHLVCKESHEVTVGDKTISFQKGESIHTENSHKYSLEEFRDMVAPWFEVKQVWTDENDWFSLQYLEPC
ncbi:dimethylhistidine N-methyltransferase [Gracilimonas mengyeensis]|uniref:Dimethylhistidine N-methyltransferase n=2 Tax=Gracilimonas mengyeensis TaxID=1302730 RepID=A0A521BS19_9BACT|nr:dimethylhistidine N-methyltransferase [Gracilimonas mengyeensis]